MSAEKPYLKKRKYLTPESIWQLFEEYKIATKANPFIVKDWVGGAGHAVEREKEKPLTIEGFENYVCNKGIINDLGEYFQNHNKRYDDFIPVIKRIRSHVRQDQIEGGMAMIYNPSITQRLNNLVERTENKHEVNEIVIKYES